MPAFVLPCCSKRLSDLVIESQIAGAQSRDIVANLAKPAIATCVGPSWPGSDVYENCVTDPEHAVPLRSAVDAHVPIAEFHDIPKDLRIVLQAFLSNYREAAALGWCNHSTWNLS
ncbi:hypothetical protein HGP14_30150 [Rhizobium sp. P32RR-XVIII]|nr:hypothetical protein [Rhizobium sp. P32RR-XVIII]NLS07539.1 hypothetical protein [Rhizobium sp. P32RR-XVIII]